MSVCLVSYTVVQANGSRVRLLTYKLDILFTLFVSPRPCVNRAPQAWILRKNNFLNFLYMQSLPYNYLISRRKRE